MNCPKCGFGYGIVIEARKTGVAKRRRRECSGCGYRFTTYEMLDGDYEELKRSADRGKKMIDAVKKFGGV